MFIDRSNYPTGVLFVDFADLYEYFFKGVLLFILHRYGEASSTDATLLGATDFLQYGGANVYVRNYLVCRTF